MLLPKKIIKSVKIKLKFENVKESWEKLKNNLEKQWQTHSEKEQ